MSRLERNPFAVARELRKVNKETYKINPSCYELRSGQCADAPLCPYGNHFQWIGFDLEKREYVRFTKSVFLLLLSIKQE